MKRETLEALESWSKIVGAVAVPITIAVVGWWLQTRIAEEATRKDYLQLAINILREDQKKQDPRVVAWATEVFQQSAPLRTPADIVPAITQPIVITQRIPHIPIEFSAPDKLAMTKPTRFKRLDPKTFEEDMKDRAKWGGVIDKLAANYDENSTICRTNEIHLEYLQGYIRTTLDLAKSYNLIMSGTPEGEKHVEELRQRREAAKAAEEAKAAGKK